MFEGLDQCLQEASGRCAVHRLVVDGEREANAVDMGDAAIGGAYWAEHWGANAEDGDLRHIQHRRKAFDAHGAEIGHGEGAATQGFRGDGAFDGGQPMA